MSRKKGTPEAKKLKNKLIVGGVLLSLGWSIILGTSELLTSFPCFITPNSCSQSTDISTLILFTPVMAGSLMVPIGFLYDSSLSRALKFMAVMATAIVTYWICYYLVVLVGIATHGL